MLSQWFFKRICKFFVKRLLGRVLKNEIDLNQLDVQLGLGSIVLKDLHLNTEYLNDRLGNSVMALKAGTVGSVKCKIPWRVLADEPCVISVEHLKLVVVPLGQRVNVNFTPDSFSSSSVETCKYMDSQEYFSGDADGFGQGAVAGGAYLGVGDGVRMIAQMVERILLNLRVKVTDLIVLVEEQIGIMANGDAPQSPHRGSVPCNTLIMRVLRLEYGVETGVPGSRDAESGCEVGQSLLYKGVKFEGATIGLVDIVKVPSSSVDVDQSLSFDTFQLSLPQQPTKILDGEVNGMHGTIKLSVPWKDGAMDVPKFHADFNISRVILKVSTLKIRQISSLVQAFTFCRSEGPYNEDTYSSCLRTTVPNVTSVDQSRRNHVAAAASASRDVDNLLSESCSTSGQVLEADGVSCSFLPLSRFITSWMYPGGIEVQSENAYVGDADLAASIDEFFECFDETRSMQQSQSSSLSNWPRSAFSALTAASSIASGAAVVVTDNGKEMEYTVKGVVAGLSVFFYWDSQCIIGEDGLCVDEHLNAKFTDIVFVASVSPDLVDCNTTVQDLEVSEVLRSENCTDKTPTSSLQTAVENVLGPFPATSSSLPDGAAPFSLRLFRSRAWEAVEDGGKGGKGNDVNFEKKLLVRFHSEVEGSLSITFTLISEHGSTFWLSKLQCYLQPLVVWLDTQTLKRIESAVSQSSSFLGYESNGLKADLSQASNVGKGSYAKPQDARPHLRAVSGYKTFGESKPCPLSLFASFIRLIICFPSESGSSCTSILHDFVVLEVSGPARKNDSLLPLVQYNKIASRHVRPSFGAVHMQFGEIRAKLLLKDVVTSETGTFSFCVKEILNIFDRDPVCGALPAFDRLPDPGISVEVQWDAGQQKADQLAKEIWDGIAAQQVQSEECRGVGGSNLEFGATTTAPEVVEERNSQLRKELLSTAALVVRFNLPQVHVNLSEPHFTRLHELATCFVQAFVNNSKSAFFEGLLDKIQLSEFPTELPSETDNLQQICLLVQCGQLIIDLSTRHMSFGLGCRQGYRPWDWFKLDLEKLQVLTVVGVTGMVGPSYLWVQHEEAQVTGSYVDSHRVKSVENAQVLLLSCKNNAIGRGDGGGGNALASGKAGLTLTYMLWPGQEPAHELFGHALFTSTLRGSTLVAHSGRFDWLQEISRFFDLTGKNGTRGNKLQSVSADSADYKLAVTQSHFVGTSNTVFLFDLQDVALSYEPGSEAFLVPCSRPENKQSLALSLDSSQVCSPVACVLASTAVRVSSSSVVHSKVEQFNILLRDVALHVLDTSLRNVMISDYTTSSMKRTGYVQIAREAVMDVLVSIDGEMACHWEVACANSQLRFDTCHDTFAAFGRLVTQIQQLFAPEFDQSSLSGNNRNVNRDSPSSSTPSTRMVKLGVSDEMDSCIDESSLEINLFDGVLEDAFSYVRNHAFIRQDDDQIARDATCGVCCFGSSGPFVRRKRDGFGSAGHSSSTGEQLGIIEANPVSNGPATFIEDYYGTLHSQGGDSRPVESPRLSGSTFRESTSSARARDSEGRGGWYAGRSVEVFENHVPEGNPRSDTYQSCPILKEKSSRESQSPGKVPGLRSKYPQSVGRVIFRDLEAKWRLYGGSDWPCSRLFDQDMGHQSNVEKNGRQSNVCMEAQFVGMRIQYHTFPAVGLYASRLVVTIQDVTVYDYSTEAPWKTVVSYNWSKARPRESSSQAAKMEMDAVRPDPASHLEEYRLSISLLPLCLHLDQRHIEFATSFFLSQPEYTGDFDSTDDPSASSSSSVIASEHSSESNDMAEEALLPFFQICEISPFTLRVDYTPRRIDISSLGRGNYAELLNLVSWKGIELSLKHVRATGVHGWSSLSGVLVGEWLEDISQNQVHKLVKGMAPIRPLYAVGTGAAKLVVLPVEQYKRDRRLLRGMRKGAMAFLRSISLEVLGLGAHLAGGAHEILKQTELAMGGTVSLYSLCLENGESRSKALQPGDTREGIQQACESISRGLERTASSLVGNPYKVYQRGGAGPAVATALRAAPAAVVAPASAAAGAVHRLVLGLRNELDPERKRESDNKHSGRPPDGGRFG